jgi:hypothetical protein
MGWLGMILAALAVVIGIAALIRSDSRDHW